MHFPPLDLQTWPRGQMFWYFSQMAPTGYSLSVTADVTQTREALKKAGKKFFPAYLWLVTKHLNEQTEFKVAVQDGQVGYYDTLTPLYAAFHDDDKTFSLMWTEYGDDFGAFHARYLENQRRFGENHGVLAQPQTPPPANAYTVSCIPWVEFTHFAVHSYENKPYYFPSVEAGRFFERGDRTLMPLSLTCHHATTDDWHMQTFLDALQRDFDHPEGWL